MLKCGTSYSILTLLQLLFAAENDFFGFFLLLLVHDIYITFIFKALYKPVAAHSPILAPDYQEQFGI